MPRAAPMDISDDHFNSAIFRCLNIREDRRNPLDDAVYFLCFSGNNFVLITRNNQCRCIGVVFFQRIWLGEVSIWRIHRFIYTLLAHSCSGKQKQLVISMHMWQLRNTMGKTAETDCKSNLSCLIFEETFTSQVHTLTECKCILFVTLIFYHWL